MEISTLLTKEIQEKLHNSAESIPPEEQEHIFIHLMLFEELKAEFTRISEEKEKIRIQNGNLKEKLGEFKKTSTSKKAQVVEVRESKQLAEARVLELEKTVQTRRINIDVQQRGQIASNEQSTWLQFKKEKHVLQCPTCGDRNHIRSNCPNSTSKESMRAAASNQIYYQRGRIPIDRRSNRSQKSYVNSSLVCPSPDSPQSFIAQSSYSFAIGKGQGCDTHLMTTDNLASCSAQHVSSNHAMEIKFGDATVIRPLSSLPDKTISSYFNHSTTSTRFKHRRATTTSKEIEIKNEESIQNPGAVEFKSVDKAAGEPLSSQTNRNNASSLPQSATNTRFKRNHRTTSRRFLLITHNETGSKNEEVYQSPRAGNKHKSSDWIEDLRLLKCRRLGHLYSNYSHILEKELLWFYHVLC